MDMSTEETKEAMKEAIKEWLDDQVRKFGWWSLKTLGALALCGVVYLAFVSTGHFR